MEKMHLVITGRRNTGKSSLINFILQQNKAVVSPIAGTTTDPVKKSYEIPGTTSLILIDTAGIDDEGSLGKLRIEKTFEAIGQADAALLVISNNCFGVFEEELIQQFKSLRLPYLILHNKSDLSPLTPDLKKQLEEKYSKQIIETSTFGDKNTCLIKAISSLIQPAASSSLLDQFIRPGQVILLVTPIDSEAPTGRMILPQVQMLRAILDHHSIGIVVQPEEVGTFFANSTL